MPRGEGIASGMFGRNQPFTKWHNSFKKAASSKGVEVIDGRLPDPAGLRQGRRKARAAHAVKEQQPNHTALDKVKRCRNSRP